MNVHLGPRRIDINRSIPAIYGTMRMHGTFSAAEVDDGRRREAFAALDAAVEAGYSHFDHADIYAGGECERTFGMWLGRDASLRERVTITTKCGIRWAGDAEQSAPHRYDFSAEHIRWSCERSLERLGVDVIDVFLLHRPDVLMEPDEVAGVFDELRSAGKVRHFGASNFTASQVDLLQSRLDEPLVCNQIEVHPLRLSPFEDGTLDHHLRHGITPTSWSPVAGGRLFGEPADEHTGRVMAALDLEAEALGTTRFVVLLAWLMTHPSGILPIVGTRQPGRIRESAAAAELRLSREAWYRIYLAGRGKALP